MNIVPTSAYLKTVRSTVGTQPRWLDSDQRRKLQAWRVSLLLVGLDLAKRARAGSLCFRGAIPGCGFLGRKRGPCFHIVGMTLFAHASFSWPVWVGAGHLASLGFFHFEKTGIAIYTRHALTQFLTVTVSDSRKV